MGLQVPVLFQRTALPRVCVERHRLVWVPLLSRSWASLRIQPHVSQRGLPCGLLELPALGQLRDRSSIQILKKAGGLVRALAGSACVRLESCWSLLPSPKDASPSPASHPWLSFTVPSPSQVLLVTSSFMSPSESRSGSNPNRVRMFGPDKLVRAAAEKRWDRVRVVCSQPYSKVPGVGLGDRGSGRAGPLVSLWDYGEAEPLGS